MRKPKVKAEIKEKHGVKIIKLSAKNPDRECFLLYDDFIQIMKESEEQKIDRT